MTLQVIEGPTIAQGESLSDGVDLTAGPLVRITMPPEWTPANLTFELSSDGNFYNPLYDVHGKEITIVVVPGSAVRIPLEWSTMIAFLKVRSGTIGHPVVQQAARTFAVAVEAEEQAPLSARR